MDGKYIYIWILSGWHYIDQSSRNSETPGKYLLGVLHGNPNHLTLAKTTDKHEPRQGPIHFGVTGHYCLIKSWMPRGPYSIFGIAKMCSSKPGG